MSASTPERQQRDAARAMWLLLGGMAAFAAFAVYAGITEGAWQLYAVAGAALAAGTAVAVSIWLVHIGRRTAAFAVSIASALALALAIGILLRGLGLSLAISVTLMVAILVYRNLSPAGAWAAIAASLVCGIALIVLDVLDPLAFRLSQMGMQIAAPVIAGLVAVAYTAYLLRLLADLSLRAKLVIAFLAVALVPLAALAALNSRAATQSLTQAANEALLGAAAQTALSIDTFLDNTRGVVQTESQNPSLAAYLALVPEERRGSPEEQSVRALLRVWQLRDTRARAYLLLDGQGVVLQATSSLDIGADLSRYEYYAGAVASGQSYVSNVHLAPGAQEGDLYFSMVIRNAAFQPAGVLVARYNARFLQDIMERTNDLVGQDSFGVVFDEHQIHLAHGTAPDTLFKLVGPAAPDQVAALQSAGRLPTTAGFEVSTNLPDLAAQLSQADQQPFFAAQDVATGERLNQVAVTRMNARPWQVAFFQPQDVFLAPVAQQVQAALVLAAAIAAAVTAAALVAAQLLANPIARLTRVAGQVAAGDLSAQAPVESSDEIGTLSQSFNTMTARLANLVGTLEQRVAERTAQLQAAADIGRATTSVRDLDELLALALELIRDRFGYYHASIFLLDEAGRDAVLRESAGEVGAQLKARGHRLAVGSRSLIGWVTQNRQPRVALDVGEDPFHFRNPLLPETRSELAIPLMVGNRLIGALDVQSTLANAFGEADVQVLQTLADQLSVAIENAELFQRTQASLDELSGLYQRMTGASWRGLVRGQVHEKVYEVMAGDKEATMTSSGKPLEVPLLLRGHAVGVIEIHGRRPQDWTADERAALDGLANQITSALESAALLEDTQRRRLREQLINEVTAQMRSTLNPASVVQTGMRELGRVLGATEVVVRLANESPTRTPEADS